MTNKELQAKLAEALTTLATLQGASPATPVTPKARPLVEPTYMKKLNPASGKWDTDDTSAPAYTVNLPDKRGKKFSADNFELLFVTRHAAILNAYAAVKRA